MLSCRRQSTARLLEAGKLSLVLDLDHTLLASSRSARVLLSSPSPAHSCSLCSSFKPCILVELQSADTALTCAERDCTIKSATCDALLFHASPSCCFSLPGLITWTQPQEPAWNPCCSGTGPGTPKLGWLRRKVEACQVTRRSGSGSSRASSSSAAPPEQSAQAKRSALQGMASLPAGRDRPAARQHRPWPRALSSQPSCSPSQRMVPPLMLRQVSSTGVGRERLTLLAATLHVRPAGQTMLRQSPAAVRLNLLRSRHVISRGACSTLGVLWLLVLRKGLMLSKVLSHGLTLSLGLSLAFRSGLSNGWGLGHSPQARLKQSHLLSDAVGLSRSPRMSQGLMPAVVHKALQKAMGGLRSSGRRSPCCSACPSWACGPSCAHLCEHSLIRCVACTGCM